MLTTSMPSILIRKVSDYMGGDILLGVFATGEEAEQQRAAYFTMRTQDPASDPWRDQPCKKPGLELSHLVVSELPGQPVSSGGVAFVLSSFSNGFGQTN